MENWDLYLAAAYGRDEEVEKLLQDGDSNINCPDVGGKTPLYIAASWGSKKHLKVVQMLLNHGADIDLQNNVKQTPLYVAASWGNPNAVLLLIQNNANVNVKNDEERTPLHIAACKKPHINENYSVYDPSSTYMLLEQAKYYMHNYLIKYSCHLQNLQQDYEKLLSVKIPMGNRVPDDVMDVVVRYNHFTVCTMLVEAGAEVNALDHIGETPLDKARNWRHIPIFAYLAMHGGVHARYES